jgi:hypothetical protein
MVERLAPATVRTHYGVLRAVCRWQSTPASSRGHPVVVSGSRRPNAGGQSGS